MQTSHSARSLSSVPEARIAIVQANWHRDLTDVMLRRCREILLQAGALEPEVHILPGSLELPLAARRLAIRQPKPEAIIAFGIIVKGETDHYDVVRDECMHGFSRVMHDCDIPIIIEVLPVTDIKLAAARCADNENNKGIEAALAALDVIAWRRAHPLTKC